MKLVFVIFVINVVFITINSEKVDSEEEYFIDDEDKFSDEDKLSEEDVNYNSDEDTNSESETVADKDKHLQTYLGLDRGFVSNKITKNWCPEDCKKEGQKYENPNLSSYCVCERNRTNNKLNTVHYYCAKHEIYNSTVHGCHKLKGNGYATCVIRNKTCPSNKTGVFKHPNKDLYKNYIVCLSDMVIVAQCKYMAYYNDTEKRCVRHSDKETILTYSDCEEAPTIDCREPGVIPVEEYFQNNSAKISDNCKNCYYLCNDRDLYSYDLAVHCFPDNDAKQKDTTTWDYTIRYSNQTTIDYKYETSATAGIAAKPLVIEPTNAEPTGLSTTIILSMKQTTTAIETDESKSSLKATKVLKTTTDVKEKTEPATAETEAGPFYEKTSTMASISSQQPTKLARTPALTTEEKIKITTHEQQTVTEEALGGTATTIIRPSATETTKTKTEVQSTEEGKSSTLSIQSTGHVISENATIIIASETSSSIPETLTKEVRKTTVEYPQITGQSTTSTLSTEQKTTAAETDKSETSPEDSTDFVETSFATEPAEAGTKGDSTHEEKSTTLSKTSVKPTKLTRTPIITTKDWEKTNITTGMEQTATEEALGGTATTRIRPSATETTKTKTEVQSTEEEKSSTSSILSTGLVILENATTIIASTKGEGETTPHTESTVFVGLPGVTHTTDTELTPIATGSGRTETIDKGGHENETSSSSPETLTKEVRKTTVEYSHTTGQSTTSTLSTKQKTTAAETDKSETSPEDSTDFVETSFATEPAEAETKDDSTQEEKSTTVSKTSLKPTKLTRTPTITTKDWEKTNITTRMEQTATEVALGGTATTSIKPSATETTKTKTGVQSTEEEKSSTTSILSAGQSTTSTLSTKQTTTAAETHKIETSPQTVTDFEETSFATEPAITETKVRSTQEEKSTTVSISSQKPTKLARTPATTSKDWENTNITTHLEQTATKEILGGTATARIRPSATKTTETGTEKVPATQLMTNIETNRLTTERTRTGPDVYSTTEESDISEKFMCQQNNFESQHCNKEGLFRFNGSCTLHYECYYSRTCGKIIPSEIYECPYCLKFNAKEMKCDLPENVPECTYHRLIKTAHCSTRRHKRHRCTGPGKFVVPENNQKYYDCIDTHINNQYHLIVKRCPRRHIFNDVTKECEKNEDCEKGFNCGRRRISQLASKCEGEHYAYDKYSCQKFYHCQHKKPKTPLCCPENYVFNVNFCQSQNTTLFCNWEELKKVLYKHNEDENKE